MGQRMRHNSVPHQFEKTLVQLYIFFFSSSNLSGVVIRKPFKPCKRNTSIGVEIIISVGSTKKTSRNMRHNTFSRIVHFPPTWSLPQLLHHLELQLSCTSLPRNPSKVTTLIPTALLLFMRNGTDQ